MVLRVGTPPENLLVGASKRNREKPNVDQAQHKEHGLNSLISHN